MGKTNHGSGDLTSGQNISFWIDTVKPIQLGKLNNDIETDVLIIGGGISGLTTAYCLVSAGKKVVLVEDGYIGSGESGRTTAHLTCALDDRYSHLEEIFGQEGSRLAAQSHTEAINWIEKTVSDLNIDCNFKRVDGFLFLHSSDKLENLREELEATRRAGLNTRWMDHVPGIQLEKGPCICYPDQGQFHLMKYLQGLTQAIIDRGGSLFTESKATDITEKGAVCNGYRINAQHIVVATNSPVNDIVTMHTKQVPFRTYVIGATIPKNSLKQALWWDTGDMDSIWYTAPYHYVRTEELNDEYDLLIVGGEDHKTGQSDEEQIEETERYNNLISWTKKRFPVVDIVYKWSGQVLEPLDYLAFLGKNPGNENIYIITGDSGNGMTHGTIGGILVSDLIMGKKNPWSEIYSPKRLPLKFPGRFLKEAASMALQYGDYLTEGDIEGTENLKAGEGAIIKKGIKPVAIYRDENNMLTAFSAVCPHLGCIVQWNAEERSFDCPCHGSRFTKEGVVINGPANENLKKLNIKERSANNPNSKD